MFYRFVRERLLLTIGMHILPLLVSGGLYGVFWWCMHQNGWPAPFDLLFWRSLPPMAAWGGLSLMTWVSFFAFGSSVLVILWRHPVLRWLWLVWWIAHFSPLEQRIATTLLAMILAGGLVWVLWQCYRFETRQALRQTMYVRWEIFLDNFAQVKLFGSVPWPLGKRLGQWLIHSGKGWLKDYFSFWQLHRKR